MVRAVDSSPIAIHNLLLQHHVLAPSTEARTKEMQEGLDRDVLEHCSGQGTGSLGLRQDSSTGGSGTKEAGRQRAWRHVRRGARRGHTEARGPRARRGARPAPPPAPSIYKAPPSRIPSVRDRERQGRVGRISLGRDTKPPRLRDQI